jgi:ELWxxDGT repeat protein
MEVTAMKHWTWVVGVISIALLLSGSPARAANAPTLVKDINPFGSSDPGPTLAVGTTVYFAATDGAHGRELWRSDGTAVGTSMVRDIRPGSTASDPLLMAVVGDTVYFQARDGQHGRELWRTNGTAAGTWLGKDITPGRLGSWLTDGTVAGKKLFFQLAGELWVTDGTTAGTLSLGPGGYVATAFRDRLYFIIGGVDGRLWRSDGTVGGTHAVPWAPHQINELAATGARLFIFSGGDYGQTIPGRLWATDGTKAGLRALRIPTEGWKNQYHALSGVGTKAFFLDGPDLWRSDGTSTGTKRLATFGPSDCCYPDGIYAAGGLVWVIKDTSQSEPGATDPWLWREIWRSNGTKAGTILVTAVAHPNFQLEFRAIGSSVFWSTRDPDADTWSLWRSDGTPGGTAAVYDGPGADEGPVNLGTSSTHVFFDAYDDVNGRELWAYRP